MDSVLFLQYICIKLVYMKSKTLSKIDRVVVGIILILALPFAVVSKVCIWICDKLGELGLNVGNWLLMKSDEVKGGQIKNKDVLDSTAMGAYRIYKYSVGEETNKK